MFRKDFLRLATGIALAVPAGIAAGQTPDAPDRVPSLPLDENADSLAPRGEPARTADWIQPLMMLGSPAEDWLRLDELRGGEPRLPLLRSPSVFVPFRAAPLEAPATLVIAPQLVYVWNSALPFTGNDGSLWAGRGSNLQIMGGVELEVGRFRLLFAPQINYQQNREFQIFAFEGPLDDSRLALSNPWYSGPETVDIPSRFGLSSFATVGPGQSVAEVAAGPVVVGAATENLWWGPAIRNAIIMSNNASGVPHLFIRTREPLATRIGHVEAQWILGRMHESAYFDNVSRNNVSTLSGLAVALHPSFEPNLGIGFARVVYSSRRDRFGALAAFDVLRNVSRPNALPATTERPDEGSDQIFTLFARWTFPPHGFEAYAEWGRYEQPASVRDFLIAPHHSQGYTLGLQWMSGELGGAGLRLQAEATYLEPSGTLDQRRVITWYTSGVVPQGYTHRGQSIGAAIGPGSSSQWLAADYFLGDQTSFGIFGERIRWDTGAFLTEVRSFGAHDVSVLIGARFVRALGGFDVAGEFSTGSRFNYLFQFRPANATSPQPVDIRNHTLRLTLSPRLPT